MSKYTLIAMVTLAASAGRTVCAQDRVDVLMFESVQAAPVPPPVIWEQPFGLIAVEPFEMGEPVQDAPYSAEVVTEVTQEFADGNRIERRTSSSVARDRRGRVRREQQLAAIGPVLPHGDVRMVTISDPVARVHYSLDPTRKVAIRSHPPGRMFTLPAPPPAHLAGSPAAMPLDDRIEAASGGEVRVEQLGAKEFDGVHAEGTRTVMTIPAGAIGNVRPIEVISERWFSPELRVVVFSRRSDPRFGETTYRLTSVVREEPDASLFQVPPEYKMEELKPPPRERKAPLKPPV